MAKRISEVIAKKVLAGAQGLAEDTPVDTGAAQTNWVVGVGSPPLITVESEDIAVGQALREQTLADYSFQQGNIFLTNNLFYVGQLNLGYLTNRWGRWLHGSLQQPEPGWMERSLEAGMWGYRP